MNDAANEAVETERPTMVLANPDAAAIDAYLGASRAQKWLSFDDYVGIVLSIEEATWAERSAA
jgi:hypothetical protein